MQVLVRLWNEKAARPPLIAFGLMLLTTLLWMLSALLGDDPVLDKTEKAVLDVVVQGQVDMKKLPSDGGGRGGGSGVTVHVLIPELAYQADVVIEPEADGSFQVPVKLQTERTDLHYSVDVSQGDQRWNAVPPQRLASSGKHEVVDVEQLSPLPPVGFQDRRAHLARADRADNSRAERVKARREKFKAAKEARLQRRGRTKRTR